MTGACSELDADQALAFVSGELSVDERSNIEAHVDDCQACRTVLAELIRGDAPTNRDANWLPGRRVGRYIIRERIGRGGMGSVFRAEDLELGRAVALKRLHVTDQQARDRLVREARAAAQLQHPNVVAVYEVGDDDTAPFIAMELVDGCTLTAWLRAKPRTTREILDVLVQAGRGLAAAHSRKLVHRDFKPENVLIDASGRARVADFGLARLVDDRSTSPTAGVQVPHTRSSSVLEGSPAYLAPELVKGAAPDSRSDQYAFGVTAFEALHGRHPFAGSTVEAMWAEMAAGRVQDGSSKLALRVDRHIRRALAVDPADRWRDIEALVRALESKPRRRWLAWAVAGVASVVALGLTIAPSHADPCSGGSAQIATVWNPQVAATMQKAFTATGLPYAASAWSHVEQSLKVYSERWATSHHAVCEATRRSEQSETLMDLRMGCLQQRRQEIGAVVDLFEHADKPAVTKAMDVVSTLSPLTLCDDVDALRTSVRPPNGLIATGMVTAVRDRIARVEVEIASDKLKPAVADAEAALSVARVTSYPPVVAEALLNLGDAQSTLRLDEAAEKTLEEAFFTAEAARHDVVAARAAALLAVHVGVAIARRDDGARWLRVARAIASRGGGGDELTAFIAGKAGALLAAEGHYDEALGEYRTQLAIRAKTGDWREASAHNAIGDTLLQLGKPDAALDEYRRAVAVQDHTLGAAHTDTAATHERIGHALNEQGKYADSVPELRRAVEIEQQSLGQDHLDVAKMRMNLAIALERLGKIDEALLEYRAAAPIIEKALGPDHPDVARVHMNIGAALDKQAKPREALAEYRRTLAILEHSLRNDHPRLGEIHTNIGLVLCELGDYPAALAEFHTSLTIFAKAYPPDHQAFAIVYSDIGMVDAYQGHDTDAIAEYQRALAIVTKRVGPDHPEAARIRHALAVSLESVGRLDEAHREYEQALAARTKALGVNNCSTALTLGFLGRNEARQAQWGPAVDKLQRAMPILEARCSDRSWIAAVRFALAKALWHQPQARGQAIDLARRSLDDDHELPNNQIHEIRAWLETHRA
jgi:tetratricopeptide (TPR) repeat protein